MILGKETEDRIKKLYNDRFKKVEYGGVDYDGTIKFILSNSQADHKIAISITEDFKIRHFKIIPM